MTARKTTRRTATKAETKPADPTEGVGEDSTGTATAVNESKTTGDDAQSEDASADEEKAADASADDTQSDDEDKAADAKSADEDKAADAKSADEDKAVPRHTVQKRDDGRAVITLVDPGDTVTMVKLLLSATDDVATVTAPQGFVVPQQAVDELGLG